MRGETHRFIKGFFASSEVNDMFSHSRECMQHAHNESGPYKKVSDFLRSELGYTDPLCIQTFDIGLAYQPSHAHVDIATAFFPSIINFWICADDVPDSTFGFLDYPDNSEVYEDYWMALERKEVRGLDELLSEKYFDRYVFNTNHQKGDVLLFDSRLVHRKMDLTPRRTLVVKYIDTTDLADRMLFNYGTVPAIPEWRRMLVFDRLRYIDGAENRHIFLQQMQRLLSITSEVNSASGTRDHSNSYIRRLRRMFG